MPPVNVPQSSSLCNEIVLLIHRLLALIKVSHIQALAGSVRCPLLMAWITDSVSEQSIHNVEITE